MVNKQSRSEIRVKKHRRLRHHLVGTDGRPSDCEEIHRRSVELIYE